MGSGGVDALVGGADVSAGASVVSDRVDVLESSCPCIIDYSELRTRGAPYYSGFGVYF